MGEEPVDIAPVRKVEIEKGDVFILCSDGLYKEVDMSNVLDYDNGKKSEFDSFAPNISDNFSFIKVEI